VNKYHCKYDPAHTEEFSDPGTLGLHYRDHHPEHVKTPNPSKKIYTCRTCGVTAKWPSAMREHVKTKHPALFTEPYHRENYADVSPADGTATASAVVHRPVIEKQHWEVDDIVLPVLKSLAIALDIEQLPAIFEWRDATRRMLDVVQ
jgi:hypothetical protein